MAAIRIKSVRRFKTLADAISISRKKAGITQRELSRRTGIDNNTIAKIEKGERKKPNVLSLKKLSHALNIDSDGILKLAGYTKEEIDMSNSNIGSNMYMHGENNIIVSVEELIMQQDKKYDTYPIIISLIDNLDITKLDMLKDIYKYFRIL